METWQYLWFTAWLGHPAAVMRSIDASPGNLSRGRTWAEETQQSWLSRNFPLQKHLQNQPTQQNTEKKQFEILDVQRSEILSLYSILTLYHCISRFFPKRWLWRSPAAQHCMAMSWSKCNLHQTLPFTASETRGKIQVDRGGWICFVRCGWNPSDPKHILPNAGEKWWFTMVHSEKSP